MPRLPFSGLDGVATPGTIQAPDAYNRTQADPAAFGVNDGQAVQNLGRALQGAGGTALDVATEQQAYANRGAITDALTQAQQGAMKVQYGDPNDPSVTGFYGLKGRQALDRYGGAVGEVQDAYKQARESLANDAQRQMFDRESRRSMMSTMATMGQHNANETRTYGIAAQDAAVQTGLTAAGQGYTNDRVFQDGLADALEAQRHSDAMKGLPEEATNANGARLVSEAWQQRILRTAADNPLAAKAMLDSNLGRLQPDTQTKLLAHLQPLVDREQGNNIIGGITGQGNGPRGVLTGPVPDMIKASATRQGIDVGDALTVAKIESGVGTAADRPGSQYRGVYQMGDAAWAARGGTAANRGDLSAQVDLGVANLAHSKDVASSAVGRPAAGWEAYLVHQQGDGGGGALLRADADRSAVDVLTPAYKGSVAAARAAVVQNGGTADMTAGQFRGLWRDKFAAAGGGQGNPVQPVDTSKPYAVPSADDLLAKADAATSGMPLTVQDHVRSGVLAWRSQQEARLKVDRTGFQREYGNTVAALQDGRDVQPLDEGRIRTLYPPEQAEQLVEQQRVAMATGNITKAVAFAGPDDMARMRQDVASGVGPVSKVLAGRGVGQSDPALPGQAEDGAASADTYKLRRHAADVLEQRIAARQGIMERDPAAYAAQNPALRQAIQDGTAQGAGPDQRAGMVDALMAEQDRLGVPEDKRLALPTAQIASDVEQLTKTDPSKADMGLALQAKAAAYGHAWPQVFASYVKHGLPSEYQALAIMDRPDQAADRSDFQRALSVLTEKKGLPQLRESVGKEGAKAIDDGLDARLADFKASVVDDQNGVKLYDTFRDSVRTLAYYKSMRGDGNALENAYQGVLGKRYDFDGTMRVPKGQLSDVRAATRAELGGLSAAGLAPIAGNDALTPDQRQGVLLAAARRDGQWVPSPDDGGLRLVVRTRDGVPRPVNRVDGTPVEVRFDRLHRFGPPAPVPAMDATSVLP